MPSKTQATTPSRDFSSAFILQRLRDFADRADRYRLQHDRIAGIARRAGFALLGPERGRGACATPSNVPLLAPHPVSPEALGNPLVAIQKYYRPLAPGHPVAEDLYARIVNVPCHPELERVGEAELESCLSNVLERSAP